MPSNCRPPIAKLRAVAYLLPYLLMYERKLVVWCWGVLWAARRGDWTDRWPTAPALVSAGPHPPPGCSKWALDVLEQKTHENK